MTHWSTSPHLIKGIDGIVSRHPNKVSYSALNGTKIESGNQPGNEIRRIYRKGKTKARNLMEPGNENKNDEFDREDNGTTQDIQNISNGEAAKQWKQKWKKKQKREQ